MKKTLKKWGEGLGIYFDKDDISIYGLMKGDILEIDDKVLEQKKNVQSIIKGIKKMKGGLK